jgi:hypothetical protein
VRDRSRIFFFFEKRAGNHFGENPKQHTSLARSLSREKNHRKTFQRRSFFTKSTTARAERERTFHRPVDVKRERQKRERETEEEDEEENYGDATRPRRTVHRVIPQKRQPIVLRLQHGKPKVDVEKFLRVYMPRLLGDPSIVGRAHHGGEKREHGSMDRGRAGFV